MNRLIIIKILLLVYLHSHSIHGQWLWEYPRPTGRPLMNVQFIDSTNAFAVGFNGTIVHTLDGGITWDRLVSNTTADLYGLYFFDSENGVVVGAQNTFLKTSDGGNTWINKPSAISMVSVSFVNPEVGLGVGSRILKTTDGGNTWEVKSETGALWSVQFIDENNAVAVGGPLFEGRILRSTDGGETWLDRSTGSRFLKDVFFVDRETGFAVGSQGIIYKTTDGGDNWDMVFLGGSGYGNFEGIYFTDQLRGIAVGGGGSVSKILRTTDGGETWTSITGLPGAGLYSVSFSSENNAIAAGVSGLLLTTSDKGINWINRNEPTIESLRSVFFISESTGKASVFSSPGLILQTYNSGQTWELLNTGINARLSAIVMTDESTVFAVGENGTIAVSKDDGVTWNIINSGTSSFLSSISFATPDIATVVGENGTILRTSDGGTTWLTQNSGTGRYLSAVFMPSPDVGIAVGSGIRLRTTNAGESWYKQYECNYIECDYFQAVHFSDPYNGIIAGNFHPNIPMILFTTDGGASWINKSAGLDAMTLFDVHQINENIACIAASSGRVLFTTNGGMSWEQPERMTFNSFYSVFFTTAEKGIIVGQHGTIMRTTTGGVVWINENEINTDYTYSLAQNYPNPFNPQTTIRFSLTEPQRVELTVFNLLGEKIVTLASDIYESGSHSIDWNAADYPSGIYFYRLQTGSFVESKKMILLR